MQDILEQLEMNQERLLNSLPEPIRLWSQVHQTAKKSRGLLISGPRGVGKSTFLLSQLEKKTLYFSSDHPLVSTTTLSEIGELAFSRGYEGLIVDEVHFAKDWSLHLKGLYDSFPRKFIWASDSSSLVLRSAAADLSRRFPILKIPYLSFREFLHLKGHTHLPIIPLWAKNSESAKNVADRVNILGEFLEYKNGGLRPFFLEGLYRERILAILEKSLYADVPYFVPQIQESHLGLMNAVVGTLAQSAVPTLNVETLTKKWSVSKEKFYALLNAMEHIGLLNIVRRPGHAATGKGAKLLLADPSMYSCLGGNEGSAREALVVTMLRSAGHEVFACKDDSEADFEVNEVKLEVGGASKKRKSADFVIRDDVEFPTASVIPLWFLCFLY